jgi:hypothetical protein
MGELREFDQRGGHGSFVFATGESPGPMGIVAAIGMGRP